MGRCPNNEDNRDYDNVVDSNFGDLLNCRLEISETSHKLWADRGWGLSKIT